MQRWRYDVESRQDDGATTRSRDGNLSGKEAGKEQGARSNLSGKEEGLGGRHEVVERGGAQPCGWLICFFLVFVAVGAVKDSVCMIFLSVKLEAMDLSVFFLF